MPRALRPPARGLGCGRARRARDRHDRHRVGQDARVQPARARRARARPRAGRALYLYPTKALAQDQFRTLAALPAAAACGRRSTTATRRPSSARQIRRSANVDPLEPGHAPRRRPAAPRPLGRAALEPPLRRRRRGARLPRRLRLARRRTSCGGCGGSRGSTAPSRSSCSPRRRSRTPASSARAARRARSRSSATTPPRAPSGRSCFWNPPLVDEELGLRGSRARGGGEAPGGVRRARPAHAHLREEPQGGRADPPLHGRPARRRLAPLARTAPATRPRSGARSSGGSARATCSASRRRTRSSSGSTSASSTR